uniref:Uncharacterized protein n=1 Tax=Ananas comosus var. bracteatus TaxID=296719 RepID=A0A6V7NSU9_ANACO|nr:unnamed protein product [Ananas comosus var. bracteatus]
MAASPTPSSSSTLLEIIIISAEDLRVGRHGRPVEKDAFVTVRTGPAMRRRPRSTATAGAAPRGTSGFWWGFRAPRGRYASRSGAGSSRAGGPGPCPCGGGGGSAGGGVFAWPGRVPAPFELQVEGWRGEEEWDREFFCHVVMGYPVVGSCGGRQILNSFISKCIVKV